MPVGVGEGAGLPALPQTKEGLFAMLEGSTRRKEAFEELWNSEFEYNVEEYQELLKACCQLGYVRPFQELIDEMVGFEVPILLSTWSSCLYIATTREYFRLAVASLQRMVELGQKVDSKTINQVMGCCEKKGRWAEALGLFDFLDGRGYDLPPLTYWSLASMLAVAERWDDFMRIERHLKNRTDFPETILERYYSTAVQTRSACRDWEATLDLLRRMYEAGAKPGARGFAAALNTCLGAGAVQQMREFVMEARSWEGMKLDPATYNLVINSYANDKDYEGARQWLQYMEDDGVTPSIITYSTLFKVCMAARRGKDALDLFYDMVEKHGIRPNAIVVSHALQAVVSSPGNHEAAMQLIEMTHCRLGVKLNSSCYSPVIKAAGEAGNSTMVWRVYQQLREHGVQPEPRTIWEAVVAMSRNYNYAKMPLLAKDLVATPITAYPKRDLAYTYQALFMAIERYGDADLGLQLWSRVVDLSIPVDINMVAGRLLSTLVKSKKFGKAVMVYRQMEERDPSINDNVNITNSALAAMAIEYPVDALYMFRKLRNKNQVDDRSYSAAFEACEMLGDGKQLRELWGDVKARGMDLDRVTFGLLLRALGSTGDVVEALSLLRQSEDYGVRLNNYTTALAIIGCKATRQWGPALAVIRELRDERGVRFNTIVYNSLLTVCESAGEWHSCIRVLNEMEAAGVSPDYASLRITLNALASANKLQEIIRLHERYSSTILRRLGNFTFRVVLSAFLRCNPKKALPLLRERQRLVAPEWIESRVYKSVLVSLGFRADCETALEVLAMVPPAQRDISIVCATVSVLLRREDMRENAVALLRSAEAEGMAFDCVGYSLGLQSCYLTDDLAGAYYYLKQLTDHGMKHGNVSANFGVSLLAQQGRWTELRDLVQDMARIEEEDERLQLAEDEHRAPGWYYRNCGYIVSSMTVQCVVEAKTTNDEEEVIKRAVLQQLHRWRGRNKGKGGEDDGNRVLSKRMSDSHDSSSDSSSEEEKSSDGGDWPFEESTEDAEGELRPTTAAAARPW